MLVRIKPCISGEQQLAAKPWIQERRKGDCK